MFKKGQKFGVYNIKGLLDGPWDFSRALSEDPFFKSDVILNALPVDSFSEEQLTALGQRLDHLFLLEHPAIVPVYDTGYEGTSFYFTTNYYDEDSFHQRIGQGLTLKQIFEIVTALAQALEYAAEKGFYHDSLSPEGLVADDNGRVSILNFGVSYSFAWASSEEESVEAVIADNLCDLGQLLKSLLSACFSLDGGGVEDCVAQLERIVECCQPDSAESYTSYQGFIDDLSALNLCHPEDESPEESSVRAMQQTGETDLISEQQRAQLLPHLRELVSARNRVQEDLDGIRQEHQETQEDLKQALEKVEQLTKRVQQLTKYDSRQERRKVLVWLFCGVVLGSVLMFLLIPGLLTEPSNEATASVVPESKAPPPLPDIETSDAEGERIAAGQEQAEQEDVSEPVVEMETPSTPELAIVENEEPARSTPAATQPAVEEEPQVSLETDVRDVLIRWSESWARQETDRYFNCYSTEFVPPGGGSRTDWISLRSSRIKRPDWIEVGVSGVRVEMQSSDRALVQFLQSYRSDRYEDQTRKVLTMVNSETGWKIVKERSLSL